MSGVKLLRFTIVVPDTIIDGSEPARNESVATTPELIKRMLLHGWCPVPGSHVAGEDAPFIPWQRFKGSENDVIVIAD